MVTMTTRNKTRGCSWAPSASPALLLLLILATTNTIYISITPATASKAYIPHSGESAPGKRQHATPGAGTGAQQPAQNRAERRSSSSEGNGNLAVTAFNLLDPRAWDVAAPYVTASPGDTPAWQHTPDTPDPDRQQSKGGPLGLLRGAAASLAARLRALTSAARRAEGAVGDQVGQMAQDIRDPAGWLENPWVRHEVEELLKEREEGGSGAAATGEQGAGEGEAWVEQQAERLKAVLEKEKHGMHAQDRPDVPQVGQQQQQHLHADGTDGNKHDQGSQSAEAQEVRGPRVAGGPRGPGGVSLAAVAGVLRPTRALVRELGGLVRWAGDVGASLHYLGARLCAWDVT